MDSPHNSAPIPDAGLPPVQPPSATMMFRLFLVPFLIVAVLVGLYLVGQTLYGKLWRTRDPEKVLRDLDNANPDIRWRAAADLSQELPRSPELASNTWFALELANRLHTAMLESAATEKEFAAMADGMKPAERTKRNRELEMRRDIIIYLGASLANFVVPVSVPLLTQMAGQTADMEPSALAESRRRALFALAAQGENLKKYDALSDDEKDRIEAQLSEGQTARTKECLAYLKTRRAGKADSFGVIPLLEKCAADDDPSIRMFAAFAANFWKGNSTEEARAEKFLVTLSRDAGTGEQSRVEWLRKNPDTKDSRPVTKVPGYEVQVNANIALARRGSPLVRFDLLEEMLDPEALSKVFLLQTPDGKEVSNETLVSVTLFGTLHALSELSKLRPEYRAKVEALLPKVEALASGGNREVSAEAKKTLGIVKGQQP